MEQNKYVEFINNSIKEMDKGDYLKSLKNFDSIINSEFFEKLSQKDRLFIRKRISWIQLSLGYYKEGWINFRYNWLKNIQKFNIIASQNKAISYLIESKQINQGEKLLIWNDGGFGDFIYQLRLLKYINRNITYKIFTSKMDHLIKNNNLITDSAKNFKWHLPINEIPRIINFNPSKYFDFNFDYLVKPSNKFKIYKDYVSLTYKTETSVHKSIPYELLKELFIEKKNLNFLVLQNNLNEEEKAFFSLFQNVSYINNLDKSAIFEDTYSIINAVKYVISIDTAISHIAGYLGKKNYLLLRHPSSFYWGYKGTNSSDYKNHIIIRQSNTDNWLDVLKKLLELIN